MLQYRMAANWTGDTAAAVTPGLRRPGDATCVGDGLFGGLGALDALGVLGNLTASRRTSYFAAARLAALPGIQSHAHLAC